MEIHRLLPLQIIYYLRSMKISNIFSEDISFGEYVMLQMITEMQKEKGEEDVWVSDIVKRVKITPQAVSKFINLAVNKGYIERLENASDRRSTGIKITDRGRAVLSKAEEELSIFRDSVFKEFSKEELTAMHELTSKLQIVVQNNYLKYKKK
jgi:DNA-binding MarR family transcriptional regulator